MDRALVMHARVGPESDERLGRLLGTLPYGRRALYERRSGTGRRSGLAGVALALEGLGRLVGRPVLAAEIEFPQDGKPRLSGGPSFSVSHSGDVVAVALVTTGEVGLDVEVEARGRSRARLERWTAVEAVLKAAGLGLSASPDVVVSEDLGSGAVAGMTYRIVPVDLGPGVVACIAGERGFSRVEVEPVDLSVTASLERLARPGP